MTKPLCLCSNLGTAVPRLQPGMERGREPNQAKFYACTCRHPPVEQKSSAKHDLELILFVCSIARFGGCLVSPNLGLSSFSPCLCKPVATRLSFRAGVRGLTESNPPPSRSPEKKRDRERERERTLLPSSRPVERERERERGRHGQFLCLRLSAGGCLFYRPCSV